MYFCQEMIKNICETNYEQIFSYANVVGMGFGYQVSNGIQTTNPVISVMVSKKYPLCQLNPSDVIPNCYYVFATDVIETDKFVLMLLLLE